MNIMHTISNLESIDEDDLATSSFSATVGEDDTQMRIDVFLAKLLPDSSRSEARRLIEMPENELAGALLNGHRAKPGARLAAGDLVTVIRPEAIPVTVLPESIPLSILYEDSDLLVIDKPRGMVTHPAPGSEHGTLVNAVLGHVKDLSGIGGELRPGIVHRLDKDTGGLILVAKNDHAHRSLQTQIQTRTAERRYKALIWGLPNFTHAQIDAPIGRHPSDRKRMAVITDPALTARESRTELFLEKSWSGLFSLVEAKLHTGRTHQIRVHCAYIKHPVVGDTAYGGERRLPAVGAGTIAHADLQSALGELKGQALHAYSLSFDLPSTGERMNFTTPLAPPMQRLIDILDRSY